MDPTFRAQLTAYLESAVVKEAIGEDAQAKLIGTLPTIRLRPHLVHVKPTYEDEDQSYHETLADGKVKVHAKTVKVRRQVVSACPDCRRALTSRGADMVCPLVPRTIDLTDGKAGHEGCVIACGTDGSI